MSPWLKAGLIGGAVLVVLNLLGIIPCVGIITCILGLLAYVGIGALAAYWTTPPRMAGQAAGQGALAAMVSAAIGGIVNAIIVLVQTAIVGTGEVVSQLPPETFRQLEEAGIDPQTFESLMETFTGTGGALLCGSVCCVVGLLIAAALGAIGGMIYAAIQPD